jgi:5-bromo-4-chloroindolyl phosphate hydrolysis protein
MASAAKRYDPKEKTNKTLKGTFLYLILVPIVLTLIVAFLQGDVSAIVSNAISFGLFLLTASIAKRGFEIEKVYKNSKLAKAPKLPYKTTAAFMLGVSTFYTSNFCTSNTFILSIVLGVSAFVGFYLYYGLDPRKDKIGNLRFGASAEDVIRITGEAKERIGNLKNLKHKLDTQISKDILTNIVTQTQEIVDAIEENPNDLDRARKFFNIYLARTEKITREYIENIESENLDDKMRQSYTDLLTNVQQTIVDQKEKLNDDDLIKLDVQMEALKKQLKHEGV